MNSNINYEESTLYRRWEAGGGVRSWATGSLASLLSRISKEKQGSPAGSEIRSSSRDNSFGAKKRADGDNGYMRANNSTAVIANGRSNSSNNSLIANNDALGSSTEKSPRLNPSTHGVTPSDRLLRLAQPGPFEPLQVPGAYHTVRSTASYVDLTDDAETHSHPNKENLMISAEKKPWSAGAPPTVPSAQSSMSSNSRRIKSEAATEALFGDTKCAQTAKVCIPSLAGNFVENGSHPPLFSKSGALAKVTTASPLRKRTGETNGLEIGTYSGTGENVDSDCSSSGIDKSSITSDSDDDGSHGAVEKSGSWQKQTEQLSLTPSLETRGASSILPQLRDHNHKTFKMPASLEEWKAGARTKPREIAESTFSPLRPSVMPTTTTPTWTTLKDDILLFKSIQAKHTKAKPSTKLFSSLPEPFQIREATQNSRHAVEKRAAKRKAQEQREKETAKRARGDSHIADLKEREEEGKRKHVWPSSSQPSPPAGRSEAPPSPIVLVHNRSPTLQRQASPFSMPLPLSPKRQRPPLPIEKNRVVMQYTVFRTRRLAQPFDGNMVGKIVRGETFVDKNKANKCAVGMMPPFGPSVARVELDYGVHDPERDGMFFGRVYYKNDEMVFVYVDRELQQFGKMDPSEFEEKPMRSTYKQLLLAPRFDVFVFLRKALDGKDGHYVVYEYDETEEHRQAGGKAGMTSESSEDEEREGGERVDGEEQDGCTENANGIDKMSTLREAPADQSLGTHFMPIFEGSYTTLAQANAKAVEAFAKWTRPHPPARMDTLVYYRDVLRPYIAELLRQFVDENTKNDEERAEISWQPVPQLRYDYEAINVVVVKSQMEGPIDLTGAF